MIVTFFVKEIWFDGYNPLERNGFRDTSLLELEIKGYKQEIQKDIPRLSRREKLQNSKGS